MSTCSIQAEIQQKLKDEKLRIALEKMKLANVKKVDTTLLRNVNLVFTDIVRLQ